MSALTDMPLTYTVEEVAALLRVGRSAAYAAVRAGDIPSIRVGRSIRVPRFQLERMLGLAQNDDDLAGETRSKSLHRTGGTPDGQLQPA